MKLTEKDIESYLIRQLKKAGATSIKLTPMYSSGWPDRLVLFPMGVYMFVELKAPGKADNLSKKQVARIRQLNELRHPVSVASTKPQIRAMIETAKRLVELRKKNAEAARLPKESN